MEGHTTIGISVQRTLFKNMRSTFIHAKKVHMECFVLISSQ